MDSAEQALFLSLYYMDDATLSQACQVNNKFRQKLCKDVWVQKIIDLVGYGDRQEIDKYMVKNYRDSYEWHRHTAKDIVPTYQQYYYLLKDIHPDKIPISVIDKYIVKIGENGDLTLVNSIINMVRETWNEWDMDMYDNPENADQWVTEIRLRLVNTAITNNNVPMLKSLLDTGITPDYSHIFTWYDVHKNLDILKILLEYGGGKGISRNFLSNVIDDTSIQNALYPNADSESIEKILKLIDKLNVLEPYLKDIDYPLPDH